MDTLVIKDYYEKAGHSKEDGIKAVSVVDSFQNRSSGEIASLGKCSVKEMKSYIAALTDQGKCDTFSLLALARAAYLSGNRELYIYFTQILERENIISNLRSHMETVLGVDIAGQIFDSLTNPATGAPPEEAVQWTQNLIDKMDETLSDEECRTALTANAHGIPPEAFTNEAELFNKAPGLEAYLADAHKRSVATLQEHADTGKVWFEQIITQPVVDFVASHKEVLGGVLEESKIYWTKIPYDTVAWLNEKESDKKRYYACHCPMAREVLLHEGETIPGKWCNCTAGFVQQRFNAIFGETVKVDLLESVLAGDERCRFAINVPEKFLSRNA
ncbi:DUF6144 family protein [Spirochaeta isovalerica]|uniref:Putative hydrocarbon binding protein n=1 Tax=Spirochaeta isovalerica TaxID=150 RepID=A0A841R9I8_9SPIO|nr:DUF6144 family protein [Spirochaeta isovalerica]MBB6482004.1 putative hydrocarbon binding protein [Spirochaeta isovalerica]